jgi:periplasmic protein TonB
MNNRYTLPIAAAVAVHASLMFGFRHPVKPVEAVAIGPSKLIPHVIAIVPNEERPDDPETTSTVAKGSANSDVARSPEPSPSPDRPVFAFSPPATPETQSALTSFDPKPFGSPDGDPLKVGTGPMIISAAGLDKAPHAQVQASPDYPFAAKKDGLDGEVVVEFLVDETGRVSNPAVVRSTNRVFDEPSLRAVLKWRFEPGRRDGRVVRFRMAVPVVFRLNND